MQVKLLETLGSWKSIKNACRTTINKDESETEPTSLWKKRILMSEHSPIRKMQINWKWLDLPYWVSVHFVRHNVGCTPFVGTQRDDRTTTDAPRGESPQNTPVTHEEIANLQAIMNISKKRLCMCASKETMEAWEQFLDSIKEEHPELVEVCVPECIYRNGLCPEFISCGYNKTKQFEERLKAYQKDFLSQINEQTIVR